MIASIQGTFLHRMKVKKPDGSYLTQYDLDVGKDIRIYGPCGLRCPRGNANTAPGP